jgi:hypothetical protein
VAKRAHLEMLGSQQEMQRLLKVGRLISERESTSSDMRRLIIGNTPTLGTGASPSFVCDRRFGKVYVSTDECFDFDSGLHLQTFSRGPTPPQPRH